MAKRKAERPVVVTTQYRGVFFGYANDTSGDVVSLNRARMCVYACDGPNANCRIGKAVDSIELRGVTAVIECGDAAAAKWEAEPWK